GRQHRSRCCGITVIAVQKIGVSAIRHLIQQGIITLLVELIPANLGYPQALSYISAVLHIFGETAHLARDNVKTFMPPHLFTLIKKQLHANANAKQWQTGMNGREKWLFKATVTQVVD